MPDTVGYSQNNKITKRLSKKTRTRFESAKDKLHFGQQYRQRIREAAWTRSLRQYNNNVGWDFANTEDMDIVNVNISFSTINTLVPYVSDENPRFVIRPSSGDASTNNAALLELFLNSLWRDPDMEGQVYITDAVWDWLIYGDGYAQLGYSIEVDELWSLGGSILEDRGEDRILYNVQRVSPWDLWIDPYSDGIHNARWVARRILMPLDELKEDDRYRVIDDLAGGDAGAMPHADPEDHERVRYMSVDEGWVAVYEFYDIKGKWMMAFTQGAEHPVRYIENVKCPIVQLANYRIANSPYHIGELENIYSLQMELNRTRSEMITHRRRNVAKWIVRKDMVSQEALTAMRSNIINDIIPIEGNVPFAQYLEQIAPVSLSADAYNQDQIIRNDINEVTGVNEYLRGQPQDISRTATEASIIEGATNVRTRHKLNQVETFLRRVGQRLLDIISDTLPETNFEEMRMYVTGIEAERLLMAMGMEDTNTDAIFTPTPETFQGRYVVDVERGTAELRNPQAQAKKYQEIFQVLLSSMPILQQQGVPVNLKRALELWFKAANVEDVNSLFTNDEQQAMLQQSALQQAMMQGQPQGGPQDLASGAATQAGQPREATTQPPSDAITPQNSGMLPAAV